MKKDKKKNKAKGKSKKATTLPSVTSLRDGFIQCADLLTTIADTPLQFNQDICLYPAEAKALSVIADSQAVNLTALAQRLGVSKSAVSKSVTKLLDKKLIDKTTNGRAIELTLSERGATIVPSLEKAQTERYVFFDNRLEQLSDKEKQVLSTVLKQLVLE